MIILFLPFTLCNISHKNNININRKYNIYNASNEDKIEAHKISEATIIKFLFRGYEKLPPPNTKTIVKVGLYINYFYAINEQSMDYRMSFYLRQNWSDPRFSLKGTKFENIKLKRIRVETSQIRQMWVPDLFFRNEKGAGYHFVTRTNILCYIENGFVWLVSKITATFACPMKLHSYPMDVQYCPLQLESFGYTTETLNLSWITPYHQAVQFDKTGLELTESVVNSNAILEDCTYNSTASFSDGQIPCIQASFVVSRLMGYYIIQFYIPSILLVMLSWVSFWISVDAVVARVNIGLMIVLNLVTQSASSRGQLPKVSYVKAIDVWMTGCLFFAFASLIEFAVVNVWSRREEKLKKQQNQEKKKLEEPPKASSTQNEENVQKNKICRFSFENQVTRRSGKVESIPLRDRSGRVNSPLDTKINEVISILESEVDQTDLNTNQRRQSWTRKRLRQWSQNFSPNTSRAHKLDKLSRRLFPIFFVVFNLVYWFAYGF